MNNKELLSKYKTVVNVLFFMRIYNMLIILAGILAFYYNIPNLSLLLFVLFINCIINLMFAKKICKYFETLNRFFED